MRKVFFLLITLAIATNSLAQEQFSDKEAALTRFYMMNCNEVKQNKILLLPKFLELNPTHDEVNEFIVNSYLGTEDYFAEISSAVNKSLEEHFPDDGNIRIIAEPGRYYVASAYTLATSVIASREMFDQG